MNIGVLGENIAVRYLLCHKYRIIERNYREGFDEIDIIGVDFYGKLIFFEVKSLLIKNSHSNGFSPEDNFSLLKAGRIVRACRKFVIKHPYLVEDDLGWQIDLIAISLKGLNSYDLRHYKNCI